MEVFMNKFKCVIISFLFVSVSISAVAQVQGQVQGKPARHYNYFDYYVMGGYQMLFHPSEQYHVATIQSEVLYTGFFASRVGVTVGKDYLSFSPIGIIAFLPKIFMQTVNSAESKKEQTFALLLGICAAQWRFPLSNHLEMSFGWDAVKFTRMKKYSDKFHVTGSLNVTFTGFCTDHIFISAYYEFNHNHNTFINILNKLDLDIEKQPKYLNGHSFGVRAGWLF